MTASRLPSVVISGVKESICTALIHLLDELPVHYRVTSLDSSEHEHLLHDADFWIVGHKPSPDYQDDSVNSSPALKGILMCGAGYDHLPVDAAAARNIPVANAPEFAVSVAEAAITLMLMIAKNYSAMRRAVDAGQWPAPEASRGHTISDKSVGIIGLGRIGRLIAQFAKGLSMDVLAYDPFLAESEAVERGADELVPLGALLARADVVILSIPLGDDTRHLIDAKALENMKSSAYLINVSRGGVVDEIALIEGLRKGQLAGAGLDVLEQEPPDPDNPLLTMPNVILTPHSLGATQENATIIAQSICGSLKILMRGERPQNTVNF